MTYKLCFLLGCMMFVQYGLTEATICYFSAKPDLFFTGEKQDHFHLYAAATRAVKVATTVYKVGSPATAGNACTLKENSKTMENSEVNLLIGKRCHFYN